MTLSELKVWFIALPYSTRRIRSIDIDYTRPIEDLNLVVHPDHTVSICTMCVKDTIIDHRKEED